MYAVFDNLRVHFGAQNLDYFVNFGVIFVDYYLVTFLSAFGLILEPILGPDRPKKGPR